MKLWWIINTERLGEETRAVNSLAGSEGWFELARWRIFDRNLCAEGDIIAHGHRYAVRLVYPDQFPEVPAWVEPQEKTRWSTHQYGGGTLCLQLRPDNWISSATGADVLRSAHSLLMIENPLGSGVDTAPSAHHVGEIQSYDWGLNPVLVSEGCRDRLQQGSSVEPRALRWSATDEVWPILIHDAQDRTQIRRPPAADISRWMLELTAHVSHSPSPTEKNRTALIAAAGFEATVAESIRTAEVSVVLFVDQDELIAYHVLGEDQVYRRRVFVLPTEDGVRSNRAATATDKSVAVVGVGSVGSKIAESLVRSGITRLVLVDGDVLLPANLERHALDWHAVGARKTLALQRRLLSIVPGVQISTINENLNWQRSARTHATQVDQIASCDVIIDATGDPGTSLFLGAVAEGNARAFVSVEVFEGGVGGLVASCLPRVDLPFVEARARFLAWCESQECKPPQSGVRRYEMLSGDGEPVVADDAAVTITAAHATRSVLDFLDGIGLESVTPWLLFGYRKAWMFEGHGHTIRLEIGARQPTVKTVVDESAADFVRSLIEEIKD